MANNMELLVENNPFLTKKIIRKADSKDARILFLYPNERGMSTIPPSIAGLSQILKNEGHKLDYLIQHSTNLMMK